MEIPLNEYPRPQLERKEWLCLNGQYEYCINNGERPDVYEGEITVPYCVESALSGVKRALKPNERLWYKRSFVYKPLEGRRALLHFGAVDYSCEVYINGQSAGKHIGGYESFCFDITDFLRGGENELIVAVNDPTDSKDQPRGKQVLNPSWIWYTAVSGIWQTVWLESVHEKGLRSINCIPDIDGKRVSVRPEAGEGVDIECEIDGEGVFRLSGGECTEIPIKNLRLWSPEAPWLYKMKLTVMLDGVVIDEASSYFGMRKFSVGRDDSGVPRLMLNNIPYFHRGLLDQGYHPEGLYTMADEVMVKDIETAKALGFNMLRKHIKVEPMRWYWHCDRLGMLVWQDMPSGCEFFGMLKGAYMPNLGLRVNDRRYKFFKRTDENARAQFTKELSAMINSLKNVVSIALWVPFNEGWGQFDAKRAYELIRELDPSRPIDHASGWYDQRCSEIQSLHRYIFRVRRPRPDGRVFALTEYGGYSRPEKGHCWQEENHFGYRGYESKEELTEAFVKLHEQQIIPLIKKGLSATVYTQLTDVENEINGLLTYDREVLKFDAEAIKGVNGKLML